MVCLDGHGEGSIVSPTVNSVTEGFCHRRSKDF